MAFSLSLLLGLPIMQMLVCLVLSRKSLKLSSLFSHSFSFCCSDWVSSTVLSSGKLFFASSIIVWCWIPPVYFSVQLLYSSALWLLFGTFLYILSLCWSSHCVYPFFSWGWWALLWLLFWTLYQVNYFSPFFKVFWGFILFFHLEYMPLFLHFAWFSVLVYAFDKTATSPRLEGLALYWRWNITHPCPSSC